MRHKSIIKALLALGLSTFLGCGKTSDTRTPALEPLPLPTPTHAPLPVVDPLVVDKPAPGFTFVDLVNGPYCTVKMKNSEQVYLLADIWNFSSGERFSFNYYLPQNSEYTYLSAVATSSMLASSDCDLEKLVDIRPVSVLLAPITIYANNEFSGEPVCTVAAGELSLSEEYLETYHDSYVTAYMKTSEMCGGITKGFLKSIPNIVTLYLKP